jgi:4-amino-4-deoxy-L-arabinose transferase-like glycosyltransferase
VGSGFAIDRPNGATIWFGPIPPQSPAGSSAAQRTQGMRAQRLTSRALDGSALAQSNVWPSIALLCAVAVLIRLPGLDHFPRNDELYTVLAARSWLIDGVLRIGDGVYDRASLFTIMVAWLFQIFGESLAVARLPALIAGSLLVVAVYVWTRSVAGNLAGWISALFVCFSPLSIQLSQYARFYTLFALAFWFGAIGIYSLFEQRPGWRAALAIAVGALLCLALSFHLQTLTVIGIIGLGVWVGLAVALPWLWRQRGRPRVLWTIIPLGILVVVVGAMAAIETGIAGDLWRQFRMVPLHALPRNQVWFYQLELIQRYPTLWPVFPFLALLALATRPRPTLFCCCVFIPSFALLSFAAMKHFIYIYFAMPFLFVVWAVALARSGHVLWRCIVTATERAVAQVAPELPRGPCKWGLIVVGLLFLLVSNGAPARTLLKPFGIALGADETSADWATAATVLQPWLEEASVVLTPDDLHALYYLGDYDIAVNPSRLSEIPDMGGANAGEFSVDPRTGRPAIGTADSLRLIMACYPDGLLVADFTSYPAAWAVNESSAITSLIERDMKPIDLPPGSGVVAFHWERAEAATPPPECASLPEPRTDRARFTGG